MQNEDDSAYTGQPSDPTAKPLLAEGEDGTIVFIPRWPIEKADMAISGYVTRPDGKIIYVEDCDA